MTHNFYKTYVVWKINLNCIAIIFLSLWAIVLVTSFIIGRIDFDKFRTYFNGTFITLSLTILNLKNDKSNESVKQDTSPSQL